MEFAGEGPWRRAFHTAAELGDVSSGGRGIGGGLSPGDEVWRRSFGWGRRLAAHFSRGGGAWRHSFGGGAVAAHFSLRGGGDRRRSFRRRRGLAALFWATAELGGTFFMWRLSLAPQFWSGCWAWRLAQFLAAFFADS